MFDVISAIFLMAAMFGIGWAWGVRVADKMQARETPYRWACMKPGCHYELETNDVSWIMAIADAHAKKHSDI